MTMRHANVPEEAGREHDPWLGTPLAEQGEGEPSLPIRQLVKECGAPAYLRKSGQVKGINEVFWAKLYAQENQILFEPDLGQFFAYDAESGAWRLEGEDKIRKRLAARIFELGRLWEGYPGLTEFRNERSLRGIITHLRGEVAKRGAFRQEVRFIHCANGMLEFDEDGQVQLKAFSPHYMSRRPGPIAYEPTRGCPQFKSMLLGHLDEDDRELLQRVAGQILLGRNLTQRIVILDGPGKASKGAFASVMRELIGHENCGESRTKLLEERFELGRLMNKSLALGADVPANFLNTPGAAKLKSMVGGDLLDIEKKNSNAADGATGHFNVLITANTRLRVRLEGDRSSWERRLTIVRYDRPFTGNKIPDVHLMLMKEEGPGILNWALEGAQKLLKEITLHGDMVLTARQHKRVTDLLDESDSLERFLKERVQTSREGEDLSTEEIIRAYAQYCIDKRWDMLPVSAAERRLPDQISALFGVLKSHSIKRDGKDCRGFPGIKFRTAENKSWEP